MTPPRAALLVLSHRVPYPPHNGAALRTYNMLRLLARDFDITGLCFDRQDAATARLGLEARREGLRPFGRFEAYPIPQEASRARFVWDHARSVLTGRPYTWYVHDSAAYRVRLAELLGSQRWDAVHVDSMDLVRMLPLVQHLPVIVTHHNVESALLRRRGGAYLRFQANAIERAERYWLPRVALNIAVSPDDAQMFRALAPAARVEVVPNGVDTQFFAPSDEPQSGCVFVGGTSWYPNRDALHWFAEEIAPRLRTRGVPAHVTWVGRATDAERREFSRVEGLTLTGYVDDIRPYVARAACYIAPLRVGGGTRLKLLDAWAMGKAIVSTTIGAEGLGARHGETMLLADTADAFADAIASVLRDEALRRRIGAAARREAEERFSWDVIGETVRRLYVVAEGSAV
ncbi:MAG TPA: glycosyltransferase [Gemmatimonadaceae bacterium]|nr:glycosyltransferase [Gemmatimonadaceae bacterium]